MRQLPLDCEHNGVEMTHGVYERRRYVVSLSFVFPHPPSLYKKKKNCVTGTRAASAAKQRSASTIQDTATVLSLSRVTGTRAARQSNAVKHSRGGHQIRNKKVRLGWISIWY